MDNTELVSKLENLLKKLAPGIRFTFRPSEFYDDTHFTFTVPYEQYTSELIDNIERHPEVRELLEGSDFYYVRLLDEPPPLVDAEIGDIVRVYYPRECSYEKDPTIGLVTSKLPIGGKFVYGCRHFLVDCMQSSCIEPVLKLSEDNYGGYYAGFLRVINPEEAREILKVRLEKARQKAVACIEAAYKKGEEQIATFFELLPSGHRMTVETLLFPENEHFDYHCVSDKMSLDHYEKSAGLKE